MNETLTALVFLYFGSTAFLGIGHYKSDGGAKVGIFGDSRFKTILFLREGGGAGQFCQVIVFCVCVRFSLLFFCAGIVSW